MMRYRYSAWDGSQVLFPPAPEDILDSLVDDLLAEGDLGKALRQLMQRGMMDRHGQVTPGWQDLLKQLRAMQEAQLRQSDPDRVIDDLRQRLDAMVARERQTLDAQLAATRQRTAPLPSADDDADSAQQRDNEARAIREMEALVAERHALLDRLAPQVGEAIRQLRQYDFVDRQAQADFDALLQGLQQQATQHLFEALRQRLQDMTSSDVQRLQQMLNDLNRLLQQREQGEDDDFQAFLDCHRDMFANGAPDNPEQFLEQMAHAMDSMQSLLNSMSGGMRQELQSLLQGVFDDASMQQSMAELMQHLQRYMQRQGMGDPFDFQGETSISLQEAIRLIERLQRMEQLEADLERVMWGADPEQIDEQQVQQLMGDAAQRQVQTLKALTDRLQQQGYIRKTQDRLGLTARGIRKIAQKALQDIFASMRRDYLGKHPLARRGAGGQRQETTRPYAYGDPFDVHLPRTVLNAVQRSSATALPVRLQPEDFEVYSTESTSRCATVLLLDMSGSMERFSRFTAAKKVALALDALIRQQFPRDTLHIVGFYTYAQEIKLGDIPCLAPKPFGFSPLMYDAMYYNPMGYMDLQIDASDVISGQADIPQAFTNMQAGLQVAEHWLTRQRTTNKQVILITDGEPTAHIRGRQICLEYPPSQRTLSETLKEVRRCTRHGITINTFMLGQDHYMERFVNELTRINRGRVFFTSPDTIGDYVLVDYLSQRRKSIS